MTETETVQERAGSRVTLLGVLVNALMIVLKYAAGVLGHSQALIADAVHSISDLFTDAVVLLGIKAGRKAADPQHPFGHARMETLASGVVGLGLLGAAVYIGAEATLNIYNQTAHHPTLLALVAAGLSVLLKEILFRYTLHVGRKIRSPVVMANAWHHRSDALSSVAVLLGVAGARVRPGWHILDAYAALVVSFFILKVGLGILRDAAKELTDTAPSPEVLESIHACVQGVSGVMAHHDLKVRTSGGLYLMELHIVVGSELTVAEGHRIAKEVESNLRGEVRDLSQIIVHVDPSRPEG
jgi:cation diffusion facilitator family transporter